MSTATLYDLTDDAIARVCMALDLKSLYSVDLVSSRLRRILIEYNIWDYMLSGISLGCELVLNRSYNGVEGDTAGENTRLLVRKYMASVLCGREMQRLKLLPYFSTSTDNNGEHVGHVVRSEIRSSQRATYWSSSGSLEECSSESLVLVFHSPLTLVTRVSIRPFLAWFQTGGPVYAPQKVRFRIGGLPLFRRRGEPMGIRERVYIIHTSMATAPCDDVTEHLRQAFQVDELLDSTQGEDQSILYTDNEILEAVDVTRLVAANVDSAIETNHIGSEGLYVHVLVTGGYKVSFSPHPPVPSVISTVWVSPEYDVDKEDRLQEFVLPNPIACAYGALRVDLIGRTQRQEVDQLFYTCLSRVKASGYTFPALIPIQQATERLTALPAKWKLHKPTHVNEKHSSLNTLDAYNENIEDNDHISPDSTPRFRQAMSQLHNLFTHSSLGGENPTELGDVLAPGSLFLDAILHLLPFMAAQLDNGNDDGDIDINVARDGDGPAADASDEDGDVSSQ